MLQADDSGEKVTVLAGINDAVAIVLPEDLTFIQGLDVLFKVPQEIAYWQDSVAWSIYRNLRQKPSARTIDYRGERATVGTFGNSLSLDLKVPLAAENTIKKDTYSYYVEDIPDFQHDTLFIRLQLAMKGTSDALVNSLFEVSVKPIFINKGKLSLAVECPKDIPRQPYTVFVDGEATELSGGGLLLTPGQHNISVVSDFYRNELRTVTIEQAKATSLSIALRDIAPTVRVAAPEHTEIYFDEKELENNGAMFTVSPGSHTVRFVIGGYEIIKTVNAVKGRSYTVSVNVDAAVTEEE